MTNNGMKRFVMVILALFMTFTVCACGHEHTWIEATCTTPKTCSACSATEGEALGHIWVEATCTTPKTCSVCGKTEGKALGHNAAPVTCTNDSVCKRCGEIIAKATGHDWTKATVSKPKTCKNCGKTEGKALGYKFFPMDSYEFINAYNKSKGALGTLKKDSNTMRIKGTNIDITFFVFDVSDKSGGYKTGYWNIPKRDFIEMQISLQTTGSDQRDSNAFAAIILIGQSFAEVVDPTFDYETFCDKGSVSASSGNSFSITYSHNGFDYELKGKGYSFGGGFYDYDFKISLSANRE